MREFMARRGSVRALKLREITPAEEHARLRLENGTLQPIVVIAPITEAAPAQGDSLNRELRANRPAPPGQTF